MIEQRLPFDLLQFYRRLLRGRIRSTRQLLNPIDECVGFQPARVSRAARDEVRPSATGFAHRAISSEAGCPLHRAYQYFAFEKSPSRRCIIACQKLRVSEACWAISWHSWSASCQSQRPASIALSSGSRTDRNGKQLSRADSSHQISRRRRSALGNDKPVIGSSINDAASERREQRPAMVLPWPNLSQRLAGCLRPDPASLPPTSPGKTLTAASSPRTAHPPALS